MRLRTSLIRRAVRLIRIVESRVLFDSCAGVDVLTSLLVGCWVYSCSLDYAPLLFDRLQNGDLVSLLLQSLDFVELLAPLVLLANHHVLVETVDETGSHLLVAFRGELVRHFVTVKVAVEGCLQSQAVEDVEFSEESDSCGSFL